MPIISRADFTEYVRTNVNNLLPNVSFQVRERVISYFVIVATGAHNFVIDDVEREIGTGPSDPNQNVYAQSLKDTISSWRWDYP
jgi:hypothetical protein